MRDRIGIAIGHDRIRAVVLRRGRVLAAEEIAAADGECLSSTLGRLLEVLALRRWPPPRIVIAIGPVLAQTKLLDGLPRTADAGMLESIVREGSVRFFIGSERERLRTGVRVLGPGVVWAAAIEGALVDGVAETCLASGLRVRATVPTVAVLGAALEDGRVAWQDGPVWADVALRNGELYTLRRRPGSAPAIPPPAPRAQLVKVHDEPLRFADAFGAAVYDPRSGLSVHGESAAARVVPRWRFAASIGALLLAAGGAVLAPDLAALRATKMAMTRLEEVRPAWQTALAAEADLRRADTALGEIRSFREARVSQTLLLGNITRTLPEDAVLQGFQADSASGSVVAFAPRAAVVLEALEQVPTLTGAEIVGPVTREVLGGRELERVAIRFRLVRSAVGSQ